MGITHRHARRGDTIFGVGWPGDGFVRDRGGRGFDTSEVAQSGQSQRSKMEPSFPVNGSDEVKN